MRKTTTYRAARRNAHFGRRPSGNTTPEQRRQVWAMHGLSPRVKPWDLPPRPVTRRKPRPDPRLSVAAVERTIQALRESYHAMLDQIREAKT